MFEVLTILYIEDNADDAYILREFVKHISKQIDIEVKPTLSEGLDALNNRTFDLVLVDLSLPDSRGLKSIEKILAQNNDIPVVALTGFMDKNLAISAIKIGVQDYLLKGDYNEHVLEKTFSYAIERHKNMKDVLVKQEQLEQAQKIAKLGRFEYDYASDQYYCSKELIHIFGFLEGTSLNSKHFWNSVYKQDLDIVKQNIVNHFQTQKPFYIDHRILTSGGIVKHIRIAMESIFDSNGRCYRTIGTAQDITKDYNRSELLRRSQERLNMAVRAGNIGVFDWHLVTGKIVCDETICGLYEQKYGDQLNYAEMFVDTLNPETKEDTLKKLDVAIKSKTEMELLFDIVLPSGKKKFIQTIAQFQMNDGHVSRMVGMVMDVTDRVEADRLRDSFTKTLEAEVKTRTLELQQTKEDLEIALKTEKELGELKSRFVATASHQFRTPLSVIQSNVELISMLNESDKTMNDELFNKAEKRIESEVKRMTDLMDDVLILGKFSSNQVSVDYQENDVVTCIKRAAQMCEDIQSDGRFVELHVHGNPKLFVFDERTLNYAFENLLTNAFKYSRSANPEVNIHFKDEHCKIEVTDYGIGIPQSEMDELFQTFYRCSNVGDISGTGLGLAIVKDYLDLNGGVVSVQSTMGKKTTFTVTLGYKLSR